MTPAEAARLLELPADATPEQIEARFLELRAKLEERIARAPTPGLQAKYRQSLETVTTAFEQLTLAADASALPVLQRQGTHSGERRAVHPEPIAAASPVAPTPDARPAPPAPRQPGGFEVLLVHLSGFYKGLLLAVVVGMGLALVALRFLTRGAEESEAWFLFRLGLAILPALAMWIWAWRATIKRARRRVAAGRSIRGEKIFGGLMTALIFACVGGLLIFVSIIETASDRGWRSSAHEQVRLQLPGAEQEWQQCLEAEAEMRREVRRLEEQQAGSPLPEAAREEIRLMLEAHRVYLRWLADALDSRAVKQARMKVDEAVRQIDDPQVAGETAFLALNDALNNYRYAVSDAVRQVEARKPVRDFVLGLPTWHRDAEAGQGYAMWNLYLAYREGKGAVEPDRQKAVDWLRRGAETGHRECMAELASRLWWADGGVAEDKPAAIRWLRQAAEAGHSWSMCLIGMRLLEGDHVEKDPEQAVEWLRRSAEAGEDRAMFSLGKCLMEGTGVAADEAAALDWWRRAAREENFQARKELTERNLTW